MDRGSEAARASTPKDGGETMSARLYLGLVIAVACTLGTTEVWAQDRVELEGTSIIGNRELPKVLYIVPWKEPNLDDLDEPPPAGLLDEMLRPIDREVFRRQLEYHSFIEHSATRDKDRPRP